MVLIFSVFAIVLVIGLGLFMIEIKNAPKCDPTEPFLHDDYDPNKDPTNNK